MKLMPLVILHTGASVTFSIFSQMVEYRFYHVSVSGIYEVGSKSHTNPHFLETPWLLILFGAFRNIPFVGLTHHVHRPFIGRGT